jgi:hypothetical protein
MGGLGSGRRDRWDAKETTAGVRRLDVRALHRAGRLAPGGDTWWSWSDGGLITIRVSTLDDAGRALFLVLHYRARRGQGEWADVAEVVTLDWAPCRYGGWRPWFECPVAVGGRSCGRRVALLYGAGTYFACRHCYRLAYPSTREDATDRALAKHQALKVRLGGSPALPAPFPPKPKGMHWRTYDRLCREAHRLEMDYLTRVGAETTRLGLMLARYERAE